MNPARASFERRLGYTFRDASLLDSALTHRSARGPHNERLEFLGDAVLNMVIAEVLYLRYPDLQEGDLSRLRAAMVRAETLAEVGDELNLGELIILGQGEMKSGGHRRTSILGDAVEAIIGAIHLDGGFEAARKSVQELFASRLASPPSLDDLKDPKTRLQEYLQSRQIPLPSYTLAGTSGEAHAQTFTVTCEIPEHGIRTEGAGRSRRAAEQSAAEAALADLESNGN